MVDRTPFPPGAKKNGLGRIGFFFTPPAKVFGKTRQENGRFPTEDVYKKLKPPPTSQLAMSHHDEETDEEVDDAFLNQLDLDINGKTRDVLYAVKKVGP